MTRSRAPASCYFDWFEAYYCTMPSAYMHGEGDLMTVILLAAFVTARTAERATLAKDVLIHNPSLLHGIECSGVAEEIHFALSQSAGCDEVDGLQELKIEDISNPARAGEERGGACRRGSVRGGGPGPRLVELSRF